MKCLSFSEYCRGNNTSEMKEAFPFHYLRQISALAKSHINNKGGVFGGAGGIHAQFLVQLVTLSGMDMFLTERPVLEKPGNQLSISEICGPQLVEQIEVLESLLAELSSQLLVHRMRENV